ncbi:MAG: hypothetical protein H3C62_10885 [Gemmatimonadaceae bacterium]|nr:hypothetical protein [Gemmatimonadaceae bacterium]
MTFIAHRARLSRILKVAAVVAVAVVPSACKKDSTAPQLMVATNTTLAANGTVTNAVANVPFAFPGGGSVISPSLAGKDLTVTFAGTSTAPTATLAFAGTGGSGSVTANVTFGSCIFAVAATTGSVGTLKVGDTITVNPCNLSINTAGAVANGVATSRSVALLLGAASSASQTVTVAVNAGGQLTLNGNAVGTVTLVPVSG